MFSFPLTISKTVLDDFGHVNNAAYLTLYEQARWAYLNENHYGMDIIQKTGFGPIILKATVSFLKELKLNDSIIITLAVGSYQHKVCQLSQTITRGEQVCSTAEFTMGLFDLNHRRLVKPTAAWLAALNLA